ncbi:TetR family transcriptional regulator C-terminal domain-containing protein [Aestuariivirga sp.]|uniref:TetR family transcriptional regulator C-terminal domain-containing protein n=1 Tax=Aestuariivirga sp. TaxID=2650926 RepID=UPI003594795A
MTEPLEHAAPHRKASRDVRRQQLIDSTIRILGQKGYAALTIADVARSAGLSTGIVIFHFNSKDELLSAVLRFLAEEYRQHWENALEASGPDPADRLRALLTADFDRAVYTPEKLAAWIAFWGETQGRPTYDQICSGPDAERQRATLLLCETLVAEGRYGLDPTVVMRALEALCDGMWFGVAADGAGHPGRITPEEAHRIVDTVLMAFFPRHFPVRRI